MGSTHTLPVRCGMPYQALLRGRWSAPFHVYLVTAVTEGRAPLFKEFWCAAMVATELVKLQREGSCHLLAWVLMPDHLHLLLELREASLAQTMRTLKGRSAWRLNRVLGKTGRVWQRGYHEHALRHDEQIVDAARYVVANPLRVGLVTRLAEYPFWDSVFLDV